MKIVLVCGSRYWEKECYIREAIIASRAEGVIHGGCRGADLIADEVAANLGLHTASYLPNWKIHGKEAGPIRNQFMIDHGKPDLVLAFPLASSAGTRDMVERAHIAGVLVIEWPDKQDVEIGED